MTTKIDLQTIIDNLSEQVGKASSQFNAWILSGYEYDEPDWIIQICFLQLLAALEALNLPELRGIAYSEFLEVKESGFSKSEPDPDGEPYSPVLGRLRRYLIVLKALLPRDNRTSVTKDLLDIIRNIHYVITDINVYGTVPQSEKDVHLRIESILKCVFPDLKHKPSISKQIKNFEPDTGIPSLKTLLEYKFLSRKEDIGMIADQLLADTRGYSSGDWERFLYVVYETNRFKTESDWNQLMRESGVPLNTAVVVLNGEPRVKQHETHKKLRRHMKNLPSRTI